MVGGLIIGVLSTVPMLSVVNCCFCLLNIGGVLGGMAMHVKRTPDDKMSMGEAGGFGGGTSGRDDPRSAGREQGSRADIT